MAATIHRLSPLDGADDFRLNGWAPLLDTDPATLLGQAHSLSVLLADRARVEDTEMGSLNPEITASAVEGIQTLMSLGLLAIENERRCSGWRPA